MNNHPHSYEQNKTHTLNTRDNDGNEEKKLKSNKKVHLFIYMAILFTYQFFLLLMIMTIATQYKERPSVHYRSAVYEFSEHLFQVIRRHAGYWRCGLVERRGISRNALRQSLTLFSQYKTDILQSIELRNKVNESAIFDYLEKYFQVIYSPTTDSYMAKEGFVQYSLGCRLLKLTNDVLFWLDKSVAPFATQIQRHFTKLASLQLNPSE